MREGRRERGEGMRLGEKVETKKRAQERKSRENERRKRQHKIERDGRERER